MHKTVSGFTIIELLIVIVVIAILAAISALTYSGVQTRAINTQTHSALQAWTKALHMYKADNGVFPPGWVCLGEGYSYGESGTETTGAQCRKDTNANFVTSSSFNTMLEPYLGTSRPAPSMVTVARADGTWRRGLMYAYNGGAGNLTYILAAYKGDVTCPATTGTLSVSKSTWGDGTLCTYIVEER